MATHDLYFKVGIEHYRKEPDKTFTRLETTPTRRENLDDSLKPLSNAADIYVHADDANRRLLNQALFKTIYIDEDKDVRVGYRNQYDGLSIPGLHADALSWAAEAKKTAASSQAPQHNPDQSKEPGKPAGFFALGE